MEVIGIIGAGTMGSGIAQLAAANGCTVHLLDVDVDTARRAVEHVGKRFERQVEKSRLSAEEAARALKNLLPAVEPRDLRESDFVIEAIVEDLQAKVDAVSCVRDVARRDTIFASNTSSLSISRLGEALQIPERVCGMHFFNPASIMPLVEIIAGRGTAPRTVERAAELATRWGKPVVRVNDTPGFIVNRVARPFYLESLRVLEEKIASCEAIDLIMREVGGFRMGPFELMDLVGIDVNYAVSCSVYEQFGRPARFKPSEIQERLVKLGRLGRKTKSGFYSYEKDKPEVTYRIDTEPFHIPPQVREAWDGLRRSAAWDIEAETGYVLARILTALMNEAALAEQEGVASSEDIDIAMKLGTNYPKGLLAWANEIGCRRVGRFLQALNETVDDGRFEPARRFTGSTGLVL